MPKNKKKYTTYEILQGVSVTLVARKQGCEEKQKDLIYSEALKAMKLFKIKGWAVQLYQQGFYQPFGKSKYSNK